MVRKVNLLVTAFRNLFRHKVKTAITMTAIVIGVALYIYVDSFMLGLKIDSERNVINFETGSVKIYSRAYFEKKDEMPMYETFYNYHGIINKLEESGYDAAPRVTFGGSLISREEEIPYVFYGIDTELEKNVLHYDRYITEGHFPVKGEFEVLLGYRGAERLKVKTGSLVRLSTVIDKKDENGRVRHINQVIDLKVAGIINTPNPKNNSQTGYIPLDILQDEMGLLLEGGITEICIRKKGVNDALLPDRDEKTHVIKEILKGYITQEHEVISWEQDAEDFIAIARSKSGSSKLVVVILFLLAYMGMANTMLMAVLERSKEIGLLRAMGITDFQLLRLFFYEAGLTGLIGAVFGMVLGILLNFYMVNVGIDFTSMLDVFGDNYGFRVTGVFKSAWNFSVIWITGSITPLLAGLTALPPVIRVLKKQIAEALRWE